MLPRLAEIEYDDGIWFVLDARGWAVWRGNTGGLEFPTIQEATAWFMGRALTDPHLEAALYRDRAAIHDAARQLERQVGRVA